MVETPRAATSIATTAGRGKGHIRSGGSSASGGRIRRRGGRDILGRGGQVGLLRLGAGQSEPTIHNVIGSMGDMMGVVDIVGPAIGTEEGVLVVMAVMGDTQRGVMVGERTGKHGTKLRDAC